MRLTFFIFIIGILAFTVGCDRGSDPVRHPRDMFLERVLRLKEGLLNYTTNHNGEFPKKLSALYPEFLNDDDVIFVFSIDRNQLLTERDKKIYIRSAIDNYPIFDYRDVAGDRDPILIAWPEQGPRRRGLVVYRDFGMRRISR
jgi:hypothetical protein